jgi:predicted KAP-like P-loop ATPase
MEQYYDMTILVLPALGALLLAWASIPRQWNRKTSVALIGALMIVAAFIMAFYKIYISPHEDYKSGFWIFLVAYLLLSGILIYRTWRIERKTIYDTGLKITTPADIVPSTLLVDEAITLKEQDRLNRNKFAEQFARTLLGYRGNSCLIAALHGPWGSGKSSLLNLIENELKNSSTANDYIIVRFNPWNISSLDQLIAVFFHELKVAIEGRQKFNVDSRKIAQLLDIFSGILMVGTLSPVGSQYFAVSAQATSKVSTVIKNNVTKSLVEIKKQLDIELSKTAKRIFILIDDIDRLDEKAARLLFRMIRLNADFTNTTYLLAFSLDVVTKLVEKDQPGYGKQYLEKIIQLPVHIPNIDKAVLQRLLEEQLDIFVNKFDGDKFEKIYKTRWQELNTGGRFFSFFKTIRDIVRYSNGLNLNYSLISNEVNMIDFMAIEGIRIFAPESYDQIRRNKTILTRINTGGALGPKGDTALIEKLLIKIFDPGESDRTETGEIVEAVCKVLFPQLRRIHGWIFSSNSEQEWRQQKLICSKEVFEKYFMLGVPQGELSEEEMKTIIALGDNHLKFADGINELFERKLGKRFLERLEDYIDEVQDENILETILGLFEIEDKIVSEPRGMLQAGADYQAARLLYLLLKKISDKTQRKQTIIDAINKASKIFLPVYLVSLITPYDIKDELGNETMVQLEFTKENSLELHNSCISKIRMAAERSELSKSPHLGMTMYRWRDWGNANEVKEYAEKLVETDEGLIDFLVGIAGEVISSSSGRRVEIRQKDVSAFINIDLIKVRIEQIKDNQWDNLNNIQKEAVDAFLRSMSSDEEVA